MANIHDMFPSIYISAYDLRGKHVTLTIKRVVPEEVERQDRKTKRMGKVTAYIVYFEKARKGLLLNKTNAKTVAKLYGDESDGWVGHPITLFPTVVQAFGEQADAVRVEDRRPPVPAANGNTEHAEEPPEELQREGVPDDVEDELDLNALAGIG